MIFFLEGDLLRQEQMKLIENAVTTIQGELKEGKDMINRVLYISHSGTKFFKNIP